MAIKNIPVNTTLSAEKLMTLAKRCDTLEKCKVAEKWINGNTVITLKEKYNLLCIVNFKRAIVYNYRANRIENIRTEAQRIRVERRA